jgi:AI-2 transport protein TqsA
MTAASLAAWTLWPRARRRARRSPCRSVHRIRPRNLIGRGIAASPARRTNNASEFSGSSSTHDADTHPDAQSQHVTHPDGVSAESSWRPRGLNLVLAVTGLLVASLALRQFAGIAAPVLLALVLVIAVHPLTGILRRRGAPMWLATTITVIAVLGLILGLAAALAVSIARLATILPEYEDNFNELVANLRTWLASLGIGQEELHEALGQISLSKVAELAATILAGLAATFSNLLFLLFVIAFMALDAAGFASRVARARQQHPEVGALDTFVNGSRRYLAVATVFGLIVAAVDIGFLWLAGIPLALLWGLLAFITNYIPNVGFIIGLIPPALLALLEGGPQLMIIVIVAYSVINFVIQSIIQPKFVSDAVNISLTVTFLSLVFWTFVIGPIGAILAVPLTLLVKSLLFDMDPSTRWMSSLLEGGPAPPEDVNAEQTPGDELEISPGVAPVAASGPDRSPDQDSAGPDRTLIKKQPSGEA